MAEETRPVLTAIDPERPPWVNPDLWDTFTLSTRRILTALLAMRLRQRMRRLSRFDDHGNEFMLVSRQQLANLTGYSLVSVTSSTNELEAAGLIRKEYEQGTEHRIYILDGKQKNASPVMNEATNTRETGIVYEFMNRMETELTDQEKVSTIFRVFETIKEFDDAYYRIRDELRRRTETELIIQEKQQRQQLEQATQTRKATEARAKAAAQAEREAQAAARAAEAEMRAARFKARQLQAEAAAARAEAAAARAETQRVRAEYERLREQAERDKLLHDMAQFMKEAPPIED